MTKKEYYNIREKIGILQQTSDFFKSSNEDVRNLSTI